MKYRESKKLSDLSSSHKPEVSQKLTYYSFGRNNIKDVNAFWDSSLQHVDLSFSFLINKWLYVGLRILYFVLSQIVLVVRTAFPMGLAAASADKVITSPSKARHFNRIIHYFSAKAERTHIVHTMSTQQQHLLCEKQGSKCILREILQCRWPSTVMQRLRE